MCDDLNVASALRPCGRWRASSASAHDGPELNPDEQFLRPTMSSTSALVCISSAASGEHVFAQLAAAMRVASPHITVTREAKAPMPLSMRSVWPWMTLILP